MKKIKKMLAFMIAAVMVMAMGVPALAADHDSGKGGSASITVKNAQIGKTYWVYQVFQATVSADGGVTYELCDGHNSVPAGFELDEKTKRVTHTGNSDNLTSEEIAAIKGYVTEQDRVFTLTAQETDFKVTNLPYGYYYISTDAGAVVAVNSTTLSDVVVIDKTSTPGWGNHDSSTVDGDEGGTNQGKVIVDGDDRVIVNESGLKEEIHFDIEVHAVNYNGVKAIYHYIITDILDQGMTYTSAPVIKINGETPDTGGQPVITYFNGDTKLNANAYAQATSFRIDIPWRAGDKATGEPLYDDNADIRVTYTAMLDPEKSDNIHYGNAANTNKAHFTWVDAGDDPDGSNTENPSNPDDPTEAPYDPEEAPASPENPNTPGGKTYPKHNQPDQVTETYTTELTVSKVDGDSKALAGAEFTLTSTNGTKVVVVTTSMFAQNAGGEYWKLKDGTYTTVDPTGLGVDDQAKYASLTDKYNETKTVATMGAEQSETTIKATVGMDGKLTFSGLGAGTYTLTESKAPDGYNKAADITFTLSFDSDDKTFESDNSVVSVGAINTLKVQVENRKGLLFPSTGGIGTRIFYILGAVLVLGAGVALVVKKKVQK